MGGNRGTSIHERRDYCEMCNVCKCPENEDLSFSTCPQCRRTTCNECLDKKGRCGFCADYDLPSNFHIVDESLQQRNAKVLEVCVTKWEGIGKHYWVNIRDVGRSRWGGDKETDVIFYLMTKTLNKGKRFGGRKSECPTSASAKRYIRDALITYRGKKRTYVYFYRDVSRRWFYKDGD